MQEFVQEITNTIQKNLKGVHTAMPGEVLSFDPGTGLASVQPKMKYKKPDGTTVDYPQITGVPVWFPQGMGQGATIAYPVKAGDGCLIVIGEQSLDYWMYGQETSTDLAFDMTNAMCIVGLFVQANSVVADACGQNAIIVDVKGTRITVKSGLVQIDAAKVQINGDVNINGKVESTGDMVAGGISQMKHTHTGDSGGSTSTPH